MSENQVETKNMILASTSTVFGGSYLDYLPEELEDLFQTVETIVFIPYARPGGISHDEYTDRVSGVFKKIGKKVAGLHSFPNPEQAVREAEAFFTGGGNTFVLVDALHRLNLMQVLREQVFSGRPYLGTSAGSNICGINMMTTNDMPIIYPPSFKTLGAVPFNINPHYLDPDPDSKHMGETRETRIQEFHTQQAIPVVGLREGSWLRVKNDEIILKGEFRARIFEKDKKAYEIDPGTHLSF